MRILILLISISLLAACSTPATEPKSDFDLPPISLPTVNRTAEQKAILANIEQSQACETDNQCVISLGVCPLDCYYAVNAEFKDSIDQSMRDLETNCAYSCIVPPEPRCIENKCTLKWDDAPGNPENTPETATQEF